MLLPICLIVLTFSQQALVARYQQHIKPITRDNLISSIELGRRERKTAARYIELINRYGVAFRLTAADERKNRRLGNYLGKKGLDDLIAALRDNYRPTSQTINSNPLSSQAETGQIQFIMVEGRLACSLREGAEIPPAEVPFIPLGDADAYLEGPQGRVKLNFVSPVRFRRQDDGSIVTINRFSILNGSDLHGRPLESLKVFDVLIIPSVTIAWGRSMTTMKIFEVSMTINGQDVWYYPWPLN